MKPTQRPSPDKARSPELLPIGLIIASVVGTAALGGLATDPGSRWYRKLKRPDWQPPAAAFGPVWTAIYALMATSMITTWHRTDGKERSRVFLLWGSNLALNFAWTAIFFRGHSPLAAGVEIVALEGTTVALIIRSWPVSRLASLILLPYAIWVGFATILTWAIFARN